MSLFIEDTCINCDVCVPECPNDAIYFGENEPKDSIRWSDIYVIDGVLDDIKQQRMFAQALDNRVKTMNSELIRIDVKMCQAFNIRPDVDRIARADGKTDARRD